MEGISEKSIAASGHFLAVAVGVSAGAQDALGKLLGALPTGFTLAIVIVQHLHPLQNGFFINYFDEGCALTVREAEEKEALEPGVIYFAPANYHLYIERDRTFSLSIDGKVNFSRPSIDVLFESAAEAYGPALIGVVLTGASRDGAAGLRRIKECGGLTIVQDPASAEFPAMPLAALEEAKVDHTLKVEEIGALLSRIGRPGKGANGRIGTKGVGR